MDINDVGYIKKDICMTKNIAAIKELLKDININDWCICGHTPIHYHAINGNIKIVIFLIENGEDPTKKKYLWR